MTINVILVLLLLIITSKSLASNDKTVCIGHSLFNVSCSYIYSNLSTALDIHHSSNQTKFLIQSGTYALLEMDDFSYLTDVIFEGSAKDEVIISCQSQAGLSFHNSSNITIRNITLKNCGIYQELSREESKCNVSLYFFLSANITIQSIAIIDSTGLALALHSTVGYNVILNSCFLNNGLGLSIILPSCLFSSQNYEACDSESTYLIEKNQFSLNGATGAFLNVSRLNVGRNEYIYGLGGGLSIFLGGNTSKNIFVVSNCTFYQNEAIFGGGIYILLTNNVTANSIDVKNSFFVNNTAKQGGGMTIQFVVTYDYQNYLISQNNSADIADCLFSGNSAALGGGLSFYASSEQRDSNKFMFRNSIWTFNIAKIGSAVALTSWTSSYLSVLPQVTFTNCTFYKNTKDLTNTTGMSYESTIGTVYVESVPVSFNETVNFTNNLGSPIYAINNEVKFKHNSRGSFFENSGNNGGALALVGDAVLVFESNVSLDFTNNTSTGFGGAIYAFVIRQQEDLLGCFVRYYLPLVPPNKWNISVHFSKNTVNGKNETIFATNLNSCGWNSDDEKLSTLFCSREQWYFSPSNNCKQEVKTLPSQIQFKSPFTHVATSPGNITLMNLVASDDNDNPVDSYFLIAQNTSQTRVADYYQYISDDHIRLQVLQGHTFSSLSDNLSDTVVLRTSFPRVLEIQVPVIALPCPPAYFLNSNTGLCECSDQSFGGDVIHCLSNQVALIRTGYWIGYYNDTIVVGHCRFCVPYMMTPSNGGFIKLPSSYDMVNDILCNGDKEGVLCTSCINASFALNILNFECIECADNTYRYTWIYVLLTQLLPVVVLFLILLLTNFHLASGYLNGAIFFAQTITTSLEINGNGYIPISTVTKSEVSANILSTVYSVLYSVWNLDFIEPIKYCLAPHLSLNVIFVWEYVVALLPMFFVLLIYSYYKLDQRNFFPQRFWRCICFLHICKRMKNFWTDTVDWKRSFRNILSSCIILAYTRCTLNSLYLLNPTFLYDKNGHYIATVPYFDGSTQYGHGHHIFFMIFALIVSIFLLLVPFMLLFCRHNPSIEETRPNFFNVLLEAFQRDFKTTDDRKCCRWLSDLRWVPAVYFLLRVAFCLTFVLSPNFLYQVIVQQILSLIMVAVFLLLQPYKLVIHNKIDSFIFLLIISINSISMYQYALTMAQENSSLIAFVVQYVLLYIPMFWIVFYIIKRILSSLKTYKRKNSKKHSEIRTVARPSTTCTSNTSQYQTINL